MMLYRQNMADLLCGCENSVAVPSLAWPRLVLFGLTGRVALS